MPKSQIVIQATCFFRFAVAVRLLLCLENYTSQMQTDDPSELSALFGGNILLQSFRDAEV